MNVRQYSLYPLSFESLKSGLAVLIVALGSSVIASPVLAGPADVLKAVVSESAGKFSFAVTIRSEDTGWESYCDRFEVIDSDGKILGTRILHHPHETEQPFTRSLRGIVIAPGLSEVMVRARMKPSGEGGETVTVKLPGR